LINLTTPNTIHGKRVLQAVVLPSIHAGISLPFGIQGVAMNLGPKLGEPRFWGGGGCIGLASWPSTAERAATGPFPLRQLGTSVPGADSLTLWESGDTLESTVYNSPIHVTFLILLSQDQQGNGVHLETVATSTSMSGAIEEEQRPALQEELEKWVMTKLHRTPLNSYSGNGRLCGESLTEVQMLKYLAAHNAKLYGRQCLLSK
jgi:hypothetical protein